MGDRYSLSNCSGDKVTDVGTVDKPYEDSLLAAAALASPLYSMSLPILLVFQKIKRKQYSMIIEI